MITSDYNLNTLYNEDCLSAMRKLPDNCFDLAIVDPPYGGGAASELGVHFHGRGRGEKYKDIIISAKRTGGAWAAKYCMPKIKVHRDSSPGGNHKSYAVGADIRYWDVAPPQEYFDQLFRVSKNQIIWGGNYFDLPPTRCFIVWRKLTISESFSMAMCEYAWTSFNDNAKWIEIAPQGSSKEERFHPTQKPVKLYSWLLGNYAKQGDRILDTHVGSASSLIACHRAGYDYLGFELDKTYYKLASERLQAAKAQISFFDTN